MQDELTGAIKYDGFKKAGFLSERKAKVVLKARKRIYAFFLKTMNPNMCSKVLDAGVAPVKGIYGVKTETNNFFEKFYPYTENITATSIEDASILEEVYKGLKFVKTKSTSTPFQNREFDIVFCNAVVEHAGNRRSQCKFIHEYCRVSKSFFFTTPNRWFPIEPHSALPFIHWLPAGVFRKLLRLFGKDALADESILNLLSANELLSLFPADTEIKLKRIRTFGWTSNLIVYGKWKE